MDSSGVYIALGSNLGDRAEHIHTALREIEEHGDIQVVRCSSLHDTEPVGGPPGQPHYLNAAAELRTTLPPRELLARLLSIEAHHGRRRTVQNGPRTLDLDLLLYRDHVIDEPDLTVPHPRMWEREFVMRPLSEVCEPARLQAARACYRTLTADGAVNIAGECEPRSPRPTPGQPHRNAL